MITKKQLKNWNKIYLNFDGICTIPKLILNSKLWKNEKISNSEFKKLQKKYNTKLLNKNPIKDKYGCFERYWKGIFIENNYLIYPTHYMIMKIYNNYIKVNNIKLTLKNVEEIMTKIQQKRDNDNNDWYSDAYMSIIPDLKKMINKNQKVVNMINKTKKQLIKK